MKKILLVAAITLFATSAVIVAQQNMRSEAGEHPRISRAIHELEDAVEYMEKAPHDFGGHKAEAIRDSRKAIEQLKLALQFRAKQDNRK